MIVVTKNKDKTYTVSNGQDLLTDQSLPQVIATCHWSYGIRPNIITNAIHFMGATEQDMIVFHNDCEYSLRKIDYTQVYKCQDN